MLGNTFGRIFRVTTCGESYGKGKGSGLSVIVDGIPPGLKLTKDVIQKELDKRIKSKLILPYQVQVFDIRVPSTMLVWYKQSCR